MPGIRLIDVRAALAALGLAGLAALAVAITTHLPVPAASGPATQASSAGLSRLQSLPLQAQSVISSTIAVEQSRVRRAAHRLWMGPQRWRRARRLPRRRAGDAAPPAARCRCRSRAPPGDLGDRARQPGHAAARPDLREWYAAGPARASSRASRSRTVRRRRPAQGVTLALTVGGSLRAQAAGSAVNFVGAHGAIAARYGGLTAVDAGGRRLPSALARQGRPGAHRGQRPRRALPDHDRPAGPAGRQAGSQRSCALAGQPVRRQRSRSPRTATRR